MNALTSGKPQPNKYGHLWNDLDIPTQDDDGDWSSYAKCSNCGAIENTDESIQPCPSQVKSFIPPKPWSPCFGDDCKHSSHQNENTAV